MSTHLTGRRHFLGGLLATGLVPKPTWADAGSPAFLSAAARPDGSFVLCGIDSGLNVRFQIPLPSRGHAATAHPTRPEAVAFARRPGTFAVVIDCVTGEQRAALQAPEGRHFYGHGTFSSDGSFLFTTENDFEAGAGRIGVWDVHNRYRRVDEWASGGIGPHDVKRLPGTDTLVIANGGIDTHPDSGRTKLNIPNMRPNLAYVEGGVVVEVATFDAPMHKNSIRHLAIGPDGSVAFGMQWQGDEPVAALVGLHRRGASPSLMIAPADHVRDMDGYVGSIAYSKDGRSIAATSPRGGVVHFYDAMTAQFTGTTTLADVGGVSTLGRSFVVTSGSGEMRTLAENKYASKTQTNVRWDNHLVPIATS